MQSNCSEIFPIFVKIKTTLWQQLILQYFQAVLILTAHIQYALLLPTLVKHHTSQAHSIENLNQWKNNRVVVRDDASVLNLKLQILFERFE